MEEQLDLYYIISENGYDIYDRNNNNFHFKQHEPYIPIKNLSYEENAKWQIQLILDDYKKMLEEQENQNELIEKEL